MQKKEKASITLSLHQEIEREVQEIEKEIARHPELDKIQVTEEMDRALLEKIHAYEKEVEEERQIAKKAREDSLELRDGFAGDASEAGSVGSGMKDVSGVSGNFKIPNDNVEFSDELVPDLTEIIALASKNRQKHVGEDEREKVVYRRKKRKYWIVSLVAVLLIVFGVGVNSVGSKSYWKILWDKLLGTEPVKVINVEDMEIQETEDGDELVAYREIKEKLNIKPVRIFYKPNKMKLESYEIYEEMQTAQLLYKYKNDVFRYVLYVNSADSSWSEKEEDVKINEYNIFVNEVEIKVEVFEKAKSKENRQVAHFKYQGVEYQLIGVMKKEEFEQILENLYFF